MSPYAGARNLENNGISTNYVAAKEITNNQWEE
jgi:hypothetical protein